MAVTVTACGGSDSSGNFDDTVTVGILHSLSGTMAISESTLVDTEKMAIEEINAAGGVTVDGKSYKLSTSSKMVPQIGLPLLRNLRS